MAPRRLVAAMLVLLLVGLCVPGSDLLSLRITSAEPSAIKDNDGKEKSSKGNHDEDYELYKVLADTIDQVERNYVKDISRRELIEAAVEGILKKLDPYSSYIAPEELDRFKTSVESEFGGIGIQVTTENGYLEVISPLVGTPAYRAGIQSGDRIVEIEGKTARDLSIDDAIKRLKGPAGKSVTFTVLHPGSSKPQTVTVTREVIHVETVLGDTRHADDSWNFVYDAPKRIGYIRITAFSRDTAKELRAAMAELKKKGLKGLVLDLRFNPGGLLSSAIEISDMFVSKGTIVSTEGRNVPKRVWEAHEAGTFDGFPTAVLVNRYSASASEIVSACLQDHNRAIVVGERSWGKGSVQNVVELEGGKSALKLTTAGYHRPSGKNIHRFPDAKETDDWGVSPNDGYLVKLSDRDMSRLIAYRRDRDVLRPHDRPQSGAGATTPRPPEPDDDPTVASAGPHPAGGDPNFVDVQLQKALDYVGRELAKAGK